MKNFSLLFGTVVLFVFLQACSSTRRTRSVTTIEKNTNIVPSPSNRIENSSIPSRSIYTRNIKADDVVDFSETLVGVPYRYGSAIKEKGFDCSGFINYVFNHFNINVPRVSKDFTNAGTPVSLEKCKRGDLILFTGTDTTGWVVGHMGFITQNQNGTVKFIHSSSGKSIGVIISGLSKYYATRFVKVIRVFNNQ